MTARWPEPVFSVTLHISYAKGPNDVQLRQHRDESKGRGAAFGRCKSRKSDMAQTAYNYRFHDI